MGNLLNGLFAKIFENKKGNILMIGLDAAGKTTILNKLAHNVSQDTIPTIGFNKEMFTYKNIEFVCTDIGGQDRLRTVWRHFFQNTDAIIYVVDSADKARFNEAQKELNKVLSSDQLKDVPVLVYANKQDMAFAANVNEVAMSMNMTKLKQEWFVQPCVATKGDGLFEGLDWLAKQL